MSDNLNQLALVGCGYMGKAYGSVLREMGVPFQAYGRGEKNAEEFHAEIGVRPEVGGIQAHLKDGAAVPAQAIVTVGEEQLYETTEFLLKAGVKRLLVEKPAALSYEELQALADLADREQAEVFVAYNRRFYASTRKARELIEEDGGVSSFTFEFTEWSHKIEAYPFSPNVLKAWFLANSTHVVDLAFYLGGTPAAMNCYTSGSLSWYDKASSFSGAGVTAGGATFSYRADWESAGRWSVEVLTKKRKLILCPLEELKCQMRGTVTVEKVELDDSLDTRFKPGIYLQTEAFLQGDTSSLLPIREHTELCRFYQQIEEGSSGC